MGWRTICIAQILIYRIYYYGNRRQPYMRLPVFYALKRIANYDFLLFSI